MSIKLSNSDYIKILQYYDIMIPPTAVATKQKAEKIMAQKLCACIKKVSPTNEEKSIGVCTRTVFKRKGLNRHNFECKKKRFVEFSKTRKSPILSRPMKKNVRTIKKRK